MVVLVLICSCRGNGLVVFVWFMLVSCFRLVVVISSVWVGFSSVWLCVLSIRCWLIWLNSGVVNCFFSLLRVVLVVDCDNVICSLVVVVVLVLVMLMKICYWCSVRCMG